MRIHYNLSGAARKALVTAISEELNLPAHYQGAPTFAYEVGGYQIDKAGMLEGTDNPGLVADLLGLHDFKAEQGEYDTMPLAEIMVPDDLAIPETAALGGKVSPYHDEQEPPTYAQPENTEDAAWAEHQLHRLQLENEQVPDYSNRGQSGGDDAPTTDALVIEVPLTGFTPDKLENLIKLVKAKETLLRTALGAEDLPIQQTADTLRFPWFCLEGNTQDNSDKVKAYTLLVEKLCAAAMQQKRVTAKDKPVVNEKFAFRVFLIRLGFVGDEYKVARKILLKNLSGNSAFKNGTPSKQEVTVDE